MSSEYTKSLNKLIEEFGRLPGIGPKTAARLAFHVLKSNNNEAMALAEAIKDVKTKIKRCKVCDMICFRASVVCPWCGLES